MKQIFHFFLFVFFLFILQTSCSLDKRLYQPGYTIEWNKSEKQTFIKPETTVNTSRYSEINTIDNDKKIKRPTLYNGVNCEEINYMVAEKNHTNKIYKPILSIKNEKSICTGCDTLLMKDGDEISAKIIEISDTRIRYKRCDNLDGPEYTIAKSKVLRITYANGSAETISDDDSESRVRSRSDEDSETIDKADRKSEGNGVAGLLFGIFGALLIGLSFAVTEVDIASILLIVGMVFAVLAIIFGLIGMIRAIVLHKRFKGIGTGIAAQIIGVITIIALYAYALTLL